MDWDWLRTLPWWVRPFVSFGLGLMVSCAGALDPDWLAGGVVVGAFLMLAGVVGAAVHLLRHFRKPSGPAPGFPAISDRRQAKMVRDLEAFGGQTYGFGEGIHPEAERLRLTLIRVLGQAGWRRHESGGPKRTSDKIATKVDIHVDGVGIFYSKDATEQTRSAARRLGDALKEQDIFVEYPDSQLMNPHVHHIEIDIGMRMWTGVR